MSLSQRDNNFSALGPAIHGRNAALARNWWAVLIRGVIGVLFGLAAFLVPGITLGSLVLVFGIYAVVDGVFAIVSAVRAAAHHERWGLLLFEGIIDIGAGLVALFMPVISILVAIWIMAFWSIVTGALMLAAAFRLRADHGNWLMGLGGVVSIIWGVLLYLWPIAGALVLTIWVGAYALIFGASMIALALRLRSRHTSPPSQVPGAPA
jgi:uncharacterized membrane protein HdeD (DUF308 family)